METRNKTIPTLIMVVTDGRSAYNPAVPARALQRIPNTWMFAAATGEPRLADPLVFITYNNKKISLTDLLIINHSYIA